MNEKLDTLMGKRLSQMKETRQRFDQNNQILIPKIQRVPKFLRQNERFAKYCSPKIISFGPIHHNNEDLKEGECYKLLWTSIFIEEYAKKIEQDPNEACKLLFKEIEDNIEHLKNMFTEDAIEGYNDNDLAWILFVDGCSLLHFMGNIDDQCPNALNLKFDQLMYIWRDAMLLENQLPSQMLEILCKESDVNLEYCYSNYHTMGECKRLGMVVIPILEHSISCHILDSSRKIYLSSDIVSNIEGQNQLMEKNTIQNQVDSHEELNLNWNTYKNIRDLKKVGIQVMANEKDEWTWTYEMCPDVRYNYECCSFFTFMDSLVDNADDVKELRLAGVVQNLLESGEELAKLFNELGDDLPTKMYCNASYTNAVAYSEKYIRIKLQIEKHYTNKWKTSLAQAYNTHFNTPWAIIAFLAASLALFLMFIQTWFAIHPK